jgi:hypothetical protein
MIRKLSGGKYRLYSRRKNPRTGKRRNLGTFSTKKAAQQHERQGPVFQAPLKGDATPRDAQRRALPLPDRG